MPSPCRAPAFSYFDPVKKAYVTAHTAPITLAVAVAPGGGAADPGLAASVREPGMLPNRIEPDEPRAELTPLVDRTTTWLGLAAVTIAMALAMLLAWSARSRRIADVLASRRVDREVVRATEAMKHAAEVDDPVAFFTAARRALQTRLASAWHTRADAITAHDVAARLGPRGEAIREVFEHADGLAYGAASAEPLEYWNERRPHRARTPGGITMIRRIALRSMFAFVATAAAAPTRDPFVAGNAAAANGDHVAAAAAFERTIADRGWSTNTLFDLGNAYASNSQRGRAILAYERALVLSPRDSAVATNLAHTREAAAIAAPATSRVTRPARADLHRRVDVDRDRGGAPRGGVGERMGVVATPARSHRHARRARGRRSPCSRSPRRSSSRQRAAPRVVIHADTARIAPVVGAEEAFPAAEGETVQIEQQRGDFVYVRDGDRYGWLPGDRARARAAGTGASAHLKTR